MFALKLNFSTPAPYTLAMQSGNKGKVWERTNVTNLLRSAESGIYYGRVKSNGRQKWRSLKTTVFSVAKLRLGDFEKEIRAQGMVEKGIADSVSETTVAHFIALYLARTKNDSALASATKTRRETAIKALKKTWPELAERDARRVTPTEAQQWATAALREGTGFVAPKAKPYDGA